MIEKEILKGLSETKDEALEDAARVADKHLAKHGTDFNWNDDVLYGIKIMQDEIRKLKTTKQEYVSITLEENNLFQKWKAGLRP